MSWTDERVEQLKKLWAEGLSASQIAAQLGGVSRNAVIGKVHRLHLPGRAKSGGSRAPRTKRPATTPRSNYANHTTTSGPTRTTSSGGGAAAALKPSVNAVAFQDVEMRPIEDVVVPISKKLKLVELSETTCKWPVGDPLLSDFHFCGHDADENAPYCTYHSKLAYQPNADKRRAR